MYEYEAMNHLPSYSVLAFAYYQSIVRCIFVLFPLLRHTFLEGAGVEASCLPSPLSTKTKSTYTLAPLITVIIDGVASIRRNYFFVVFFRYYFIPAF